MPIGIAHDRSHFENEITPFVEVHRFNDSALDRATIGEHQFDLHIVERLDSICVNAHLLISIRNEY